MASAIVSHTVPEKLSTDEVTKCKLIPKMTSKGGDDESPSYCYRKNSFCQDKHNFNHLQGPPGKAGPSGPPGPDGKQGPAGEGSALSSQTITPIDNSAIIVNPNQDIIEVSTSNFSPTLLLGAPTTPHFVRIRLLHQNGLPLFIQAISGGEFSLNASIPEVLLFWDGNKWNILDAANDLSSFSPYVSVFNTFTITPTPNSGNLATGPQGVSLSANRTTMVVGAPTDASNVGSAFVYVNSNGIWNQEAKLVGAGAIGNGFQGTSVSLSADGDTLAIGGPSDDTNVGAVWIFTRTTGTWTQQAKLVPTTFPAIGASRFGEVVALSADGNTLAVGAPRDNTIAVTSVGAVWIWNRDSGGSWSENAKLIDLNGAPYIGGAVGTSVALDALGQTMATGNPGYNSTDGRVIIYILDPTNTWVLQQEIAATGLPGNDLQDQGRSVTLSADGNTVGFGAPDSSSQNGRAWIFVRSNGVWTQQGTNFSGYDSVFPAAQGSSVTLTSDGNNFIVGGPRDFFDNGATWIWRRIGTNWSQYKTKLSNNAAGSREGSSVSVTSDGSILAVVAPFASVNGSVFIYGQALP